MAENHTVIAEQGAIRGTIRGAEDVVVFGYVEGRVELDGTLFVEPSGIVKADVQARHVVVAGVVVGDLIGRECIEVAETGRIVGNLTTPRLVMAAGGAVRGRVTMDAAERATADAPRREPARPTPPPPSRPAPQEDETPWRRPTAVMPAAAPVAPAAPATPSAPPARTAPAPAPAPAAVAPAPAPAPIPAPPSRVAHVPAEPAPAPRSSRRRFEDLDTLFPVIPESSMDAWAVSVPTSDRDDGPKDR